MIGVKSFAPLPVFHEDGTLRITFPCRPNVAVHPRGEK
jgi:hypothetical protein